MVQAFLLVFLSLFPIVNPPGSALLFLSFTRRGTRAQRAALAKRIAIYSFLVLITALSIGAFVLQFFGISVPVLRVAGGLVLALSGWQVMNAPRRRERAEAAQAEAEAIARELDQMAFYPLTMPLTSGPGSVAVAVALGTQALDERRSIDLATMLGTVAGALVALLAISVLVYVCYRFSDWIQRALGESGSDALGRLFAFILICLGIQVLWDGFAALWTSLPRR